MTRFFTRLFATRKPAARPDFRTSLHLDSLEARNSPSGMGIGQALKGIAQALKQSSALQAAYLSQHGITVHHGSLADLLRH